MSTPEELVRIATSDDGLLVQASTIRMRNVCFLDRPTIPFGTITLTAGEGDRGKSTLAVWHAARASRGRLLGDVQGVPVDVVIATAEDGNEETMAPRLKAAGADMNRVHLVVLEEGFQIPDGLPRLARQIERVGARFLVIDPLLAFIPMQFDSHKDQHARGALAPLAGMAADHELAVEAIMHLNKGESSELFRRVSSSAGIFNAARSVLLVAIDPDDESKRIVAHGKHNLSVRGPSMRFGIEPVTLDDIDPRTGEPIRSTRVVWHGESRHSVEDLLRVKTDHRADPRNRAAVWLVDQLEKSALPSEDVRKLAAEAGHAWATVRRAQKELGIVPYKDGFKGPWMWALDPEDDYEDAQGDPEPRSEHLRLIEDVNPQVIPKMRTSPPSSGPGDHLGHAR